MKGPQIERLKSVHDLVDITGHLSPSAAVLAGGERVEDLRLVESARDHGIIGRIILVGRTERIQESMAKVGIEVPPQDVVHADNDKEAAATAVGFIKDGEVGMMLKGTVSTPVLHRHMLPMAIRSTVSLVTLFDAAPIAGGRPMIVTDAGVNTVCSLARMVGVVRNAIDVARTVMAIPRPRVALLTTAEVPPLNLPSQQLGEELASLDWPDAEVCGPIAFDLATDLAAVNKLGTPDLPGAEQVCGQADVLVCPTIESANVVYKILSAMAKYGTASLANIIVGFPTPYVLLSRSDALDTRLHSIAMGSICDQRDLEGTSPEQTFEIGVPEKGAPEAPKPSSRLLQRNCTKAEAQDPSGLERFVGSGGPHCPPLRGDQGGCSSPCAPASSAGGLNDHGSLGREKAAELAPEARVSGLYGIDRGAALDLPALRDAAQEAAREVGRPLDNINLVVAHLDEAITIATFRNGQIIDATNPDLGGPFTAQGAGQLPVGELIDLCFSGRFTQDELLEELTERGGLVSYLGESDIEAIEERIAAGDEKARLAVQAMAYQVAKEIGAMLVAADCDAEAIVLAGSLTRSPSIRNEIRIRVNLLAPVIVI